ncbi:cysteine desulfurase family protein [Halobacillus faecis]
MSLYLDNSATTQVLPEVKDAMLPYLFEEFGNPSSKYYARAESAKSAVKEARTTISDLIGCEKAEVIFTSGATESNNFIIKGVADFYSNELGNHIVTSKVEHPSVLETCKYLETKGFRVTYLEVDHYGRVDLDEIKEIIDNDPPLLLSVIWGNNEVGSLNPIKEIAQLCGEHNIFFHSDATQVVGKIDINLEELPGLTFMSCSAHKVHGPKGTGAAFIRSNHLGLPTKITPLLHGGEQEEGYRSGTLPVHNIVGFGKAAEVANRMHKSNVCSLEENEQYLTEILQKKFRGQINLNHDMRDKIPGILSVTFKGVNNELLAKKLAPYVSLSTGSACSTGKPSHVLQAMGYSLDHIRSTIRISMSPYTNKSELNIFNEL